MLKHDGQSGLDAFKSRPFDLCVLDIKMPKKDGFTLAEEIKQIDETIPIIFNYILSPKPILKVPKCIGMSGESLSKFRPMAPKISTYTRLKMDC